MLQVGTAALCRAGADPHVGKWDVRCALTQMRMDVGTGVTPLSNTEPYALQRPDLLLSLTQVTGGSFHFRVMCVNVVDYFCFVFSLLMEPLHRSSVKECPQEITR